MTASDDGTARIWDADERRARLADPARSRTHCGLERRLQPRRRAGRDRERSTGRRGSGTRRAATELEILRGHGDVVCERRLQPRRRAGRDRERRRDRADLGRRRAASELETLRGHRRRCRRAAFSPDGERVVTAGSTDETARIWDAGERERSSRPCAVTTAGVQSAAFSPDGERVVTAARIDETARIWDAASGASRSRSCAVTARAGRRAPPSAPTATRGDGERGRHRPGLGRGKRRAHDGPAR